MKELAGRLAALDPDAGAAVRVIAYFDRLVAGRAGLEAIVRGAAVLAGCPARLVDPERRVQVRVTPDGVREDAGSPPPADWPAVPIGADGQAALWLERPGPAGPVDAMVLERAAVAARDALERTRGRAPASSDPALLELLFDASAPEPARLAAAHRLGLPTAGVARAIAVAGGAARVVVGPGRPVEGDQRAGVGPAVPPLKLPSSWAAARVALRLTAQGTAGDPGPRVVYAEEAGGLAVLAAAVGPDTPPAPDVLALERAASTAPWALATLAAVAATASLRTAAVALTVHHSTLQDRLAQAERVLGWNVRDPSGKLRLQLALALRRLHRHPPL